MEDEFDDILKDVGSEAEDLDFFEPIKPLKAASKPILKNSKNHVERLLEELENSDFVPDKTKVTEKLSTATREAKKNQARKIFPSVLNPVIDLKGDNEVSDELFLLGRRELAELDEEVIITNQSSKKIKPVDIYPDNFDSDEDHTIHNPLVVKVNPLYWD